MLSSGRSPGRLFQKEKACAKSFRVGRECGVFQEQ